MSATSRRQLFAAGMVLCLFAFSGCLTLNPTVSADTSDSAVFENLSPTESWSGPSVRVNATLRSTPAASNVTTLTVVQANGQTYDSYEVGSGQSTVVLSLPTSQNATIVASNSVNSTTVEELNVSTGGNELP
jgi:hypothetical protein